MVFRISAIAHNLPLTEELIWTVEGVHAVEVSAIQAGSLTVYGEGEALATHLGNLPDLTIDTVETVEAVNWAEHWKQYWHVTPVSDRLTIVPSWEDHTPQRPDEVIITLDPGSAFGTGAHETTRLMLQAIDQLDQGQPFDNQSVLDVGTGSGILAIAAAKLGSRMVTGQDIDPAVIPVAEANSALNETLGINWTATPLEDMCLTQYDVILANILAPVIIELLPALKQRLAPGGRMLLSGIINPAETSVREALTAHGLTTEAITQDGIWRCIKAA